MKTQSGKFSLSALSSVGRAQGRAAKSRSVQIDEVADAEMQSSVSKDEGNGLITHDRSDENTMKQDGRTVEKLGVGGSNPSALAIYTDPRTGIPATFTPDWLAADMVALARIEPSSAILEPSAGIGSIVKAIHRVPHFQVHAVELNERFCSVLRDMNCTSVTHKDFLRLEIGEEPHIDRVIMNPPFKFPVEHVMHASRTLKRGGRLVALLHLWAAQVIQRYNPQVRLYHLPANTFKFDDITPAPAVILVADVP